MTTEPTADDLRAMAEHRGLKLVRSRKRTPGVGDYGKFGLTDAGGKPLLGMGDDGLTATAEEVEQYLRGGIVSSWKRSAETTPDSPPAKGKKAREPDLDEERPVHRKSADPSRGKALPPPARRKQDPPPPPRARPVLRVVEPEPIQEPELKVRAATNRDARAIGKLLAQLADPPRPASISRNLETIAKTKAGIIVAEKDGIVGVCAWAAVPTLQRGLMGRITLLLVDKDQRRRGIATAMLAAADQRLAKAGCDTLEAMSDIMIANAHNFFRARGFEQKSYRFVRAVEA